MCTKLSIWGQILINVSTWNENREWRNSYCPWWSIVLPNLRDPVELNITFLWALGIFQIVTLPAIDSQTTFSLSPCRMWSVVTIAVRRPEACCGCVYLHVHLCVHGGPFNLLYDDSILTLENRWQVEVFYNFRFQRLEHFLTKR